MFMTRHCGVEVAMYETLGMFVTGGKGEGGTLVACASSNLRVCVCTLVSCPAVHAPWWRMSGGLI